MASSNPVANIFNKGASPSVGKRARIDGRTAGFTPDGESEGVVEWMGMTPAPGRGDGWYVILVQEEPNQYLSQVKKGDGLVKIQKVIGGDKNEPLSFEKAVEYLAVWEFARMAKGTSPIPGNDREGVGRHHFKDILMRRGYLATTTGELVEIADIYPSQIGKFLKSDLDALQQYQEGLRGENILNELIHSKDPLFVSETSLDDDLESFGEISMFSNMAFFTDILVHYAGVKLEQVQKFFEDPTRKDGVDLPTAMSRDNFFTPEKIAKINEIKAELADGIFRACHVERADWDKEIDLNSREIRKELMKNPEAVETLRYLDRKISYPLTQDDVDSILFTSARALDYFRQLLDGSKQKDLMERKGVYKQGDIDDLLNYLDLLDLKYEYKNLAELAVTLPGTKRSAELEMKKDSFKVMVDEFKQNLKRNQDYSPAMEKQVDDFIRAGTPVYLLDRIATMPEKMTKAAQFVRDRLLPPSPKASGGAAPKV
jgi:hypothetical protein